jgi:acetyl esterase/lipase
MTQTEQREPVLSQAEGKNPCNSLPRLHAECCSILLRVKHLVRAAFLLLPLALPLSAQAPPNNSYPPPIPLWNGAAPGALGDTETDKPRMYAFLPATRSTTAAILIIPGGGYQNVGLGYEGFEIAEWFNQQGMAAFVLDYRVAPYRYPVEIDDGRRAMRLIRAHATDYGIDPHRLGVLGSSAGGHLASSLGTHCGAESAASVGTAADPSHESDPIDALECRPDFMVLAYPVISMQLPVAHAGSRKNLLGPNPDPALEREYSNDLAVTAATPPTFLFATERDPVVPVLNSLSFYQALQKVNVAAELHLYDYANHGCGLCGDIPSLSTWPLLLHNWLIVQGWLPANAPPAPTPSPRGPFWPQGFTGPGMPKPQAPVSPPPAP